MAKLILSLWVALGGLLTINSYAAIEVYQFQAPAGEKRFQVLAEELRCPKCQNQNIAGSDSPIAKDMREELVTLLNQGYTDQQIIDAMVQRFGDYVTYTPPVRPSTWLLWYLPFVLLAIGGLVILGLAYQQKRKRQQAVPTESDAERQARLQQLLHSKEPNS